MGAAVSKQALEHARYVRVKGDRALSSQLMAWGKSDTYQCGVPINGTILRPKPVANMEDVPIAKVFAGHKHSAALLSDGSMRSWGRNEHGQLGTGRRSDPVSSPTCLDQLEHSLRFSHAALGGSHSLLVDEHGSVWAAGSNEWGQLGLGTPLTSLSSEFQKPLSAEEARQPEIFSSMPIVMIKEDIDSRLQSVGLQSQPTGEGVAGHLARPAPAIEKERAVATANVLHTVAPQHLEANDLAAAAAGLSSVGPLLALSDIVANEVHWPIKIGRDLSPLFDAFSDGRRVVTFAEIEFNRSLNELGLSLKVKDPSEFIGMLQAMPNSIATDTAAAVAGSSGHLSNKFPSSMNSPSSSSLAALAKEWMSRQQPSTSDAGQLPADSYLGNRRPEATQEQQQRKPLHELKVSKVAAGNACSAALTTHGQVWMFGYAHYRQFANGNAVQTEALPLDGRPARMIAENGGAVDISMGLRFCVALTRNGAVVLWGKVAPDGLVCNWGVGRNGIGRGVRGAGRVTSGLPAMTHIAAGLSHVVMSDGQGVWQMRVVENEVRTTHSARRLRFDDSFAGVNAVAAGGDASAVIDNEGKLWMWGQVMDTTDAGSLPVPKTALGQLAAPCMASYLHQPQLITGLDPVLDIALGTQHVLAVTDTS